MLKKYCTTCGRPVQYLSEPPVSCSGCGESFGEKSAKKKSRVKKTVPKKTNVKTQSQEDDEDRYADGDSFSTNIEALDFSVQRFTETPMTIASLAKLGEQGDVPREPSRNPPKAVDGEEFLKDFQREAGSLRDRSNGGT